MIIGAAVGNEVSGYQRWASWFRPGPVLMAFNQLDPAAFASSIPWILNRGKEMLAAGASTIVWSVPFPGSRQIERVAAGHFEADYWTIAKSIAAVQPEGDILVRLPWEFNLGWQENAAIDRYGNWSGDMFLAGWNYLADMFRRASPRFRRIWCPNILTMDLDPSRCLPRANRYEIIALDFYMQAKWNEPGSFAWFRDRPWGLEAMAALGKSKGKPIALTEFGMDSDLLADDLRAALAWAKAHDLHHLLWWDRPEVIDCRLSDGHLPKLGEIFKGG